MTQCHFGSLWFRCFFLDKIREKLKGHAPSDSMEVDGSEDPAGDIDTLVNDCKFSMKLQMTDSAWKQVKKHVEVPFVPSLLYHKLTLQLFFQNNFPVATKLLKELHREAKTNRGWLLRWVHSFSCYNHKRSQTQGPVDQISAMMKIIPLLGKLGKELFIYSTERLLQLTCQILW